jgi:hypothetical protein
MANFGRVIEVTVDTLFFSSEFYTIEGTVPFDNDPVPNESEIKIWNLSYETIGYFNKGAIVTVTAGYKGDTGLLLKGFISKVETKSDGVDRVTTIHVMDSDDFAKREVRDIAYQNGVLASYILRQMAAQLGLPIAQFELNQDYKYEEGYTASGEVTKIISDVAADCGTSAYVNKGQLYIRNLRIGADDVFLLSPDTGLIGSPEPFTEDDFTGYHLESQLQYRITTASVIDVKSKYFEGRVHARSGSHSFSGSGDFKTTVEAILP